MAWFRQITSSLGTLASDWLPLDALISSNDPETAGSSQTTPAPAASCLDARPLWAALDESQSILEPAARTAILRLLTWDGQDPAHPLLQSAPLFSAKRGHTHQQQQLHQWEAGPYGFDWARARGFAEFALKLEEDAGLRRVWGEHQREVEDAAEIDNEKNVSRVSTVVPRLSERPLGMLRYRMVPRRLSEQAFWRRLFRHVQAIREEVGLLPLPVSDTSLRQVLESLGPAASGVSSTSSTASSGSGSGFSQQGVANGHHTLAQSVVGVSVAPEKTAEQLEAELSELLAGAGIGDGDDDSNHVNNGSHSDEDVALGRAGPKVSGLGSAAGHDPDDRRNPAKAEENNEDQNEGEGEGDEAEADRLVRELQRQLAQDLLLAGDGGEEDAVGLDLDLRGLDLGVVLDASFSGVDEEPLP